MILPERVVSGFSISNFTHPEGIRPWCISFKEEKISGKAAQPGRMGEQRLRS